MSRYGGDRMPAFTSPRGRGEVFYSSRKPITRRAGHRARVTLETGAPGNQLGQDEAIDVSVRRESFVEPEWLQRRREKLLARPVVYHERLSRPEGRSSFPTKMTHSSPGRIPSVPPPEPVPGTEYVLEEPYPPVLSEEYIETLEFKIPKSNNAVQFSDDVAFVIPDSSANDSQDKPSPLSKPKFTGQMTEFYIAQSQWVGNTFDRGELGAELFTIPAKPGSSEEQPNPLMRWYHLHRPMMNFEEFVAASQSILQLPDKEERDVVKLLRDVQKKFEKQRHNGREMEPNCVSDVFYNDATGNARQTESVIFLSFPYFCLEQYNSAPIKALDPSSLMHPARPMLQAHFYSSTYKREMAQAIASLPMTPQGACLHISQLWCLVVNGSTMVTCSRLSTDVLSGESIQQAIHTMSDDNLRIKVSLGNDRSWMMPVTSQTSWPAFLAFFGEKVAGMDAQGASAKFEYNKQKIDGKLWHELLEAAKTSTVELTMRDVQFHVEEADEQMIDSQPESDHGEDMVVRAETAASTFQADPDQSLSSAPQPIDPTASTPLEPRLHLQIFKHAGSTSDMRSLADSLHNILLSNERTAEYTAYRQCPQATIGDINSWLRSDLRHADRSVRSNESLLLRKPKRRIVLLAKYLFHLFWPLDFEHAMTDRFWGALSKILNREDEFYVQGNDNRESDISAAIDMYNVLHDDILPLASMLVQEFIGYEDDLQPLPDAISKAWLHLIMAIILAAETSITNNSSFHESIVSKHLRSIPDELEKAKVNIMARLHSVDLDDVEICTESSIIALLVNNIAKDVMNGSPDVVNSYTTYFQSLEFNVTEDPAPRIHQEKIRFFLQEVEAVLATLEDQLSVIETYQQSLEQQSIDNDAILIYNLGTSRQSVVIENCKARISGRIDKFKGLQKRAEDLGEWHRNEMDTHKDRQENAILIFTIVTIIFLPLSFVSSVFGMNTKDVRDMPYNQWAYWAASIPLTILVVVGSLWWAGELWSIGRWIARAVPRLKLSRNSGQQALVTAEVLGNSRLERMGQQDYEKNVEQLSAPPRRRTTYPRRE